MIPSGSDQLWFWVKVLPPLAQASLFIQADIPMNPTALQLVNFSAKEVEALREEGAFPQANQ